MIFLNFIFMSFKCFMRSISILTDDGDVPADKDVYDIAHDYRFFLFSIIDIFNGVSLLYCFHCMAVCNRQRSEQIKNESGTQSGGQ